MRPIIVRKGIAYGREAFYPENDAAEAVCRIARGTSLTRDDLALLAYLGHDLLAYLGPNEKPAPIQVTLKPPAPRPPDPDLARPRAPAKR